MNKNLWHRCLAHRGFLAGASLTGLVVGMALLSLFWTPWPPGRISVAERLMAPDMRHWLGTDHLGRDILSLLLAGARNSVLAGLIAVSLGLSLGTATGLVAAACPDWLDDVLMRGADVLYAFPAILFAIMLTALLGPGLATATLAIGLFNIPVFARLARASASMVWTRDFILAARVAGKGTWAITLQHVLPNIQSLLIVQATIQFALAVLAEAALSYLGLGTQPPAASWGRMLNEAQGQLFNAPALALYPGLAIALFVLGLNLLGDALRDLTDPRLVRSQ